MDTFDPIAYINERRPQRERMCPERTKALLDSMGRPQDRVRFVHVAGTNGKGSTCAYLANILQEAGYHVGLFTSPYIIEFAERIRVDGENISHEELLEATLFVRGHVEAYAREHGEYPTEFEVMCAVAFEHFARCACDIVVCEVGLGGRRDPTNCIQTVEASVITRLGLDHMELLGDTLPQIAYEKAGIIKPNVPVVSWPQDTPEAMEVIEREAAERTAELIVPDFSQIRVEEELRDGVRGFTYQGRDYATSLVATYQPYNAALAIEAVRVLRERGWDIPADAVSKGIRRTYWPGRFELATYKGNVLVIDGAHNAMGAQALRDSIESVFCDRPLVCIMGALADKDYRALIRTVLPRAQGVVCVSPPSPRALTTAELAQAVREELAAVGTDLAIAQEDSVRAALDSACELGGEQAILCAFGSLYLISEVEELVSR